MMSDDTSAGETTSLATAEPVVSTSSDQVDSAPATQGKITRFNFKNMTKIVVLKVLQP
jgi:hypothetical protein